jgi:bifunctional DNase/RNase
VLGRGSVDSLAGTIGHVEIAMELVGVRVEIPDNTPVLLLREQEGRKRILPIMIGNPEASAIHLALEGVVAPRPMTHDLFVEVVGTLGATLERVVITELREHTFYAELHLATGQGERVVSSRPSDALALAVRTGSAIFASDELLDAVGQEAVVVVDAADDDPNAEAILDEFHDFIENISPDDFSS